MSRGLYKSSEGNKNTTVYSSSGISRYVTQMCIVNSISTNLAYNNKSHVAAALEKIVTEQTFWYHFLFIGLNM